jgi:hypothetical protein
MLFEICVGRTGLVTRLYMLKIGRLSLVDNDSNQGFNCL